MARWLSAPRLQEEGERYSHDKAPYGARRSLHQGKLRVAANTTHIQISGVIKTHIVIAELVLVDWIVFNEDILSMIRANVQQSNISQCTA